MTRVAVIGAAGYVGRELCSRLSADGMDVTGVVRPSSGFLLDHVGVEWIAVEDVARAAPFEVVINLAYPTGGSVYEYPERNLELVSLIDRLSAADGSVLQVSTQAVFGMALEYPQVPGPLPMRRDFLYVETKLELENLLAERTTRPRLEIIRLGNVWGPGSAAWTGALAQRMLFGEPVAVTGRDGLSNATDIANLVSYLSFVARSRSGEASIRFHHLAELGSVPWSYWISNICAHLGVSAVATGPPSYPTSARREVRDTVVGHPRAIARDLKDGRFAGSAVRSLMRALPSPASNVLRKRWATGGSVAPAGPGEDLLLTVLGCETLLVPVVDANWAPPVDAAASASAVADWLARVGYT